MRFAQHAWLLAALLTVTVHGQTATNSFRPLALRDCIQTALQHNRDIQIERFSPVISRLTLDGSYSYYDPNFTVGSAGAPIGHSSDSGVETYTANAGFTGTLPTGMKYSLSGDYVNRFGPNSESFDTSIGLSISQPLLKDFWIDQGRLNIQVNKQNLKVSAFGVDFVVMTTISQVEQAYYELIFARENVRVGEKLLEVRQRFFAETKRKVEVGSSAQLDLQLAQSQVATVQAALIQARNQVMLAENALKTLMGDDFVNSVGLVLLPTDTLLVMPENPVLPESWQRGLAHRPDLAQLRVSLDIASLNLKFNYNQLFPTFDLVAGYGLRGSSAFSTNPVSSASASSTLGQIRRGENPNDLIGVLFSVPLTRTGERANYKISQESKARAAVQVKKLEELVLRQIDDATKNVKTSLESVAATREATLYAQAALDAEEKKLAAGKSTPFVVLSLQGDLATAQTAEIRAKANYNQALSQLYFAEGSTLERNKVTVEIK